MNLDWYLIDWTQTTNTIDYGIKSAEIDGETTHITFERIGLMPMPIDFEVEYTDGTKEQFYIPLRMMRGQKPTSATVLEGWAWAHPEYRFKVSKPVKSIVIDPMQWMADVNKANNTLDSTKMNRLN